MEANAVNKNNCSKDMKVPLALFAVERNSKKRLLFDVSSKKMRGISSTIFPDATCAFENGGWLLMVQHKPFYFEEQIVFLVHPSTGRQVDLPVLHSSNEGFFVFYVDSHGTPLAVACIEIMCVVPTVHIACPGDVYWSVYKHISVPRLSEATCGFIRSTYILDVALLGTQAVCIESHGEILIFNITEMTWRTVPCPKWSEQHSHFLVASNGKVVLISRPHTLEDVFKFFKLDTEALGWSPLDDWELDNSSWFLCKGQSFRVKEEGKRKVYTFGPNRCSGSEVSNSESSSGMKVTTYFAATSGPPTLKSITNIYAYDLVGGTVEMIIPASIMTEACRWLQPDVFASIVK